MRTIEADSGSGRSAFSGVGSSGITAEGSEWDGGGGAGEDDMVGDGSV